MAGPLKELPRNDGKNPGHWRDKGVWERVLETLIDEPGYAWLMIDASQCIWLLPPEAFQHACLVEGGGDDGLGFLLYGAQVVGVYEGFRVYLVDVFSA